MSATERAVTVLLPIQMALQENNWFAPEDIAALTAAFEAALSKLALVERRDPMATSVAKLIIELAKNGERDADRLCDGALKIIGRVGRLSGGREQQVLCKEKASAIKP